MKKIIFAVFFILGAEGLILAQNNFSSTENVTLGTQGYIGNSLIFQGWGESHFIRNESIDNIGNGRSRLRMYLTDDWTYDQGFEIIAKRYDGPLRTLLYIPGDGSQTNFFSGASFGGNVGIGTTTPDEKLTVKGKIHAQEVRVDLQGACAPDYVFQKYYTGKSTLKSDYVMPTLAEIESFTKKNHHLPNVPSAQEIQQNGVSLGTMSNVLLQKVEELTLYAIEQQKKLEKQNQTIETQSKILEVLTTRLNSLEKK